MKNTRSSCFFEEYETVCVKVEVKRNQPHVQSLLAKRGYETGSSVFVQILKQAAASNRPEHCVSKGLYVLSGKRKTVWTFQIPAELGMSFLFLVLFYFMEWNGMEQQETVGIFSFLQFLSTSACKPKCLMMCQNKASLLGQRLQHRKRQKEKKRKEKTDCMCGQDVFTPSC